MIGGATARLGPAIPSADLGPAMRVQRPPMAPPPLLLADDFHPRIDPIPI